MIILNIKIRRSHLLNENPLLVRQWLDVTMSSMIKNQYIYCFTIGVDIMPWANAILSIHIMEYEYRR